MNIAELIKVAEWLEQPDDPAANGIGFDMSTFMDVKVRNDRWIDWSVRLDMIVKSAENNWCGTTCCIAGLVVSQTLRGHELKTAIERGQIMGMAAEKLGLDDDQAHILFMPPDGLEWSEITRAEAALVVRNLIATGEIDWSLAVKPEAEEV